MKSYFSTHLGLRYMWNIFIQILIWPIFKSSHSLSSGTEVHLHISLGQWDEARESLWTKRQGCGRKLLAKGGEVGIPGCLLTFVEEGGFKAFTAPSFPCKWLVWKCYPAHCGLFTAGSLQNRDSAVGRTVFRVTQQIMKLVLLRNLFRNLFINYIIARYPPVKKTFQSFGINTYVLACDMVTSLKWIARPLVYPCLRTLSFCLSCIGNGIFLTLWFLPSTLMEHTIVILQSFKWTDTLEFQSRHWLMIETCFDFVFVKICISEHGLQTRGAIRVRLGWDNSRQKGEDGTRVRVWQWEEEAHTGTSGWGVD